MPGRVYVACTFGSLEAPNRLDAHTSISCDDTWSPLPTLLSVSINDTESWACLTLSTPAGTALGRALQEPVVLQSACPASLLRVHQPWGSTLNLSSQVAVTVPWSTHHVNDARGRRCCTSTRVVGNPSKWDVILRLSPMKRYCALLHAQSFKSHRPSAGFDESRLGSCEDFEKLDRSLSTRRGDWRFDSLSLVFRRMLHCPRFRWTISVICWTTTQQAKVGKRRKSDTYWWASGDSFGRLSAANRKRAIWEAGAAPWALVKAAAIAWLPEHWLGWRYIAQHDGRRGMCSSASLSSWYSKDGHGLREAVSARLKQGWKRISGEFCQRANLVRRPLEPGCMLCSYRKSRVSYKLAIEG